MPNPCVDGGMKPRIFSPKPKAPALPIEDQVRCIVREEYELALEAPVEVWRNGENWYASFYEKPWETILKVDVDKRSATFMDSIPG